MRTEICFCGLNIQRTLNKLSQNYVLFDVKRQGKTCQITVETAVAKQIVAYLEEKCYNVVEIKKIGASSAIERFQRHFVLLAAVVLGIVALVFSSKICWKICVDGDYSEQEVLVALDGLDVRQGSWLSGFQTDVLENKLAVRLDAMYAVVHRKGSVLYVNAVKRKQTDRPIDVHSRRDIVATQGGTVVELLCEQGTPAVSVGDTVCQGDVLVWGLRTFNDGTTEEVYALGNVVLQQSCSAFAEFDGTVTETVDSGRTFCANSVWLFGKNYGKRPPFESYRTESETFCIFPLNVTVERVVYYETQTVTRSAQLAEAVDELKRKALQQATELANFAVESVVFEVQSNGVKAIVLGSTQIN